MVQPHLLVYGVEQTGYVAVEAHIGVLQLQAILLHGLVEIDPGRIAHIEHVEDTPPAQQPLVEELDRHIGHLLVYQSGCLELRKAVAVIVRKGMLE